MSNHPLERKLPVYMFHINRMMITLPITEQAKQQDWNLSSPWLRLMVIHILKKKLMLKTQET